MSPLLRCRQVRLDPVDSNKERPVQSRRDSPEHDWQELCREEAVFVLEGQIVIPKTNYEKARQYREYDRVVEED